MFPLFLLITYWVVVVMVWMMSNWRGHKLGLAGMQFKSFITFLIIVTITVVFFGYNTVTEELMRTVNCINVHRESDEFFSKFAAVNNEQFWAEDTELICFKGKHTATAVFGILGLVFFSFGFIAFILFWLFWNQNMLNDPNFVTRYGFIFRAYRKGIATAGLSSRKTKMATTDHRIINFVSKITIYWEAVITMRKALISAAVVFAYKLGGNLQGILALGVLVLALAFQLLFRPFRKFPTFNTRCGMKNREKTMHDTIDLNHLESFSIFVSTVTFYSGIVFHDEHTSHAGEIVMSVFVYVLNITLLAYFVWRIYEGTHVVLDLKLKALDCQYDEDGWLAVKFIQLIKALKERGSQRQQPQSGLGSQTAGPGVQTQLGNAQHSQASGDEASRTRKN